MTEAYASVEETMAYYGNDTHPGAHFTFNFNLVSNSPSSAQDFNKTVHQWVDNVPEGKQSNWVVSTIYPRDFTVRLLICDVRHSPSVVL